MILVVEEEVGSGSGWGKHTGSGVIAVSGVEYGLVEFDDLPFLDVGERTGDYDGEGDRSLSLANT